MWTTEQKLAHLVALPWTIAVTHEDGELVARVTEVQGVLAVANTERQLQIELSESLEMTLAVMLDHGDPIRVPPGMELPWERGEAPPEPKRVATLLFDRDVVNEVRAQSSASVMPMAHA